MDNLDLPISPQPDETTCGPTCLHAVYGYFGDERDLADVIAEVPSLSGGGTLGVLLGCHALRSGYRATIYSYKLQIFDPTWAGLSRRKLADKLRRQLEFKTDEKIRITSEGYLDFLAMGGDVRFADLTGTLLRRYLRRGPPVIAGLSATYLYGSAREFGPKSEYDDLRGEPAGHFVVLSGYDMEEREVAIADPLVNNPLGSHHYYRVRVQRLINAILLGVLTYDANLLIIQPKRSSHGTRP